MYIDVLMVCCCYYILHHLHMTMLNNNAVYVFKYLYSLKMVKTIVTTCRRVLCSYLYSLLVVNLYFINCTSDLQYSVMKVLLRLMYLTFIGPCIVISFLQQNQLDIPMYQIYFIFEWHSTCFGRSFRPSSGVQDCTYSNMHLSNIYCCLLASR